MGGWHFQPEAHVRCVAYLTRLLPRTSKASCVRRVSSTWLSVLTPFTRATADSYPEKPPRVRFTSEMYHPNVYRCAAPHVRASCAHTVWPQGVKPLVAGKYTSQLVLLQ